LNSPWLIGCLLLGLCGSASVAYAQGKGDFDPLFEHRCNVIIDPVLVKASKPEQQAFFRNLDAPYQAGIGLVEAGRFPEALSDFLSYADTVSKYVARTHYVYLDVLVEIATVRSQMRDFNQALIDAGTVFHTSQECYGIDNSFTLKSATLLAVIYQNTGRWNEALDVSEKVLDGEQRLIAAMPFDKASSPAVHRQLTVARWNVTALQYRLGDLEHARAGAQAMIEETKTLDPSDPERFEFANIAWYVLDRIAHRRDEDQTEAFAGLQATYEGMRALLGPDHPRTFPLLANEGFAAVDINAGRGADILKDYVTRIERERLRRQLPTDRQIFLEASGNAYQRYAFAAADAEKILEAFHGMELSKARSLEDSFAVRLAFADQILPTDQASSLKAAEARVSELESRLESLSADPVARVAVSKELDTAKTSYAKAFDSASASSPRFRMATQSEIAGPEKARSILRQDEVFISYLTERSDGPMMKILVSVLEPSGKLTVADLGDCPGLDFTTQSYDIAIARPDGIAAAAKEGKDLWSFRGAFFFGAPGGTYPEATLVTNFDVLRQAVSDMVLPKALRDLLEPYKHWVVSPSGPLWNIPFETLADGDGLIIDNHAVRYVHSWTMFTMLADAAQTRKRAAADIPVVAVGGATYSDYRLPQGTPPAQYPSWKELGSSKTEVKLVAQYFGLKDGVTVFQGKAALRSTVLGLNSSGKLAHVHTVLFSTHGLLDATNPARSSLILGRPEGGFESDRYLTARELATFDMPADLVVVSSCDSGNGRVAAGEGILGLPYAIFAAGAASALVTRWKVFDDDTTAHLVSDLLIAIDSGKSPDDALAEIKRDLRRTKPEAYWAPFVLLGH